MSALSFAPRPTRRSARGAALRRGVALRRAAVLVAVTAGLAPAVASAIPPGGVAENPRGAVATVAPSELAPGAVAQFSGAGFTPGEEVTVKVDNGAVLRRGSTSDVFGSLVATSDGTISGSVDLAAVNEATPVTAGPHLLRFLSAAPAQRSLHADFTVVAPTPAPGTPTPTPGPQPGVPTPTPGVPGGPTPTTPGATTPKVRGVVWLRSSTIKVRSSRATLKVQAAAAGSAGKVSVRSVDELKLAKGSGKGKSSGAARRALFKTESYFVGKAEKATIRITLTADGKRLLRPGTSLKAIVRFADVVGETVTETITVQR